MSSRFSLVLFFVVSCSSVPVFPMMSHAAGGGSGFAGSAVAAEEDLQGLVVVANRDGDLFEKFVAEVEENLADEVRHRIGRLGRELRPEENSNDFSFLSSEYYRHCVAEAATIRGSEDDEHVKNFILRQKSKELIQSIMEWLPARAVGFGSTEKKLEDFGMFVPPVFKIYMSRDNITLYIPNPYFLNEEGVSSIQQLVSLNPGVEKRVMLRPGAAVGGAIGDAHAILLTPFSW